MWWSFVQIHSFRRERKENISWKPQRWKKAKSFSVDKVKLIFVAKAKERVEEKLEKKNIPINCDRIDPNFLLTLIHLLLLEILIIKIVSSIADNLSWSDTLNDQQGTSRLLLKDKDLWIPVVYLSLDEHEVLKKRFAQLREKNIKYLSPLGPVSH